MPSIITPGARVLLPGANGYIATWILKYLLDGGYVVRGTVRSEEKATDLLLVFKDDVNVDKLEVVVVDDVTKEGAFDEVVKDVQAVIHTASPFHFDAADPQEIIGPALNGTLGILTSCLRHGSDLKRVVYTSSFAAIFSKPLASEANPQTRSFSELDWNQQSVDNVKRDGVKATGSDKYKASKTLAEQAAWSFMKQHSDELQSRWDLVVLNPPSVFGAALGEYASGPTSLPTSLSLLYNIFTKEQPLTTLTIPMSAYIDVRDLAEGHIKALELPSESSNADDQYGTLGRRLIISAGYFTWQDFLDIAGTSAHASSMYKGEPGAGKATKQLILCDITKFTTLFPQFKNRSMKETVDDTLGDFVKRGWMTPVK